MRNLLVGKASPVRLNTAVLLPITVLFGCYIAVVLWFRQVDFYHRHFFDTGPIVFADNALRVVFGLILCWLIYAPGASILALIGRRRTVAATWPVWPAERALLGFGVGLGVWHVVMLILGVLGLYYRSVMIVLCAATLLASAGHFGEIALASWRALILYFAELRSGRRIAQTVGAILVILAAICLLLVRGLYPGGGHDYYTHYFYYYLEVLKNHSLAPNDVWYHYWYSKGYGLFFLGMLLTDPEAPALVTFCCVALAALSIAVLVARMAPSSFWPALAALIYLLFNLVSISHGVDGEFQKDHEQISALLVLVAWALCMELATRDRLFLVMATATGVAAAIVTQSMGVLVCFFLGWLAATALVRRRWPDVWAYGIAAATVGGTVFAIFLLSYVATGLASDQALDLMLRFANVAKLDRWGVIPQLVIIAWGRDNYVSTPLFDWATLTQLDYFIRAELLWPLFAGIALCSLVALAIGQAIWAQGHGGPPKQTAAAPVIRATIARLGLLLAMLVVISVPAGHGQSGSYERFSTFFVPLLVLLGVAGSGWVMLAPFPRCFDWIPRLVVPAVLLFAVLMSWQVSDKLGESAEHWASKVLRATSNGLKFFIGKDSLAAAYSTPDTGLIYGGITPEVFKTWQHVDPGTPIWATNVSSNCTVPGCVIESVATFRLSARYDEIIAGSPELAKRLLQQAGIDNFLFLFTPDAPLVDLLPYSQLFAPNSIGKYLGVKWTDGSAYLLTWIGPDTKPLGADFFDGYAKKLADAEIPMFQYGKLAEQIRPASVLLRAKKFGAAPVFPWRAGTLLPGTVDIVDATYGQNCSTFTSTQPGVYKNEFHKGNWTESLRKDCNRKASCTFEVSTKRLGDPVGGCAKDFSVAYRCAAKETPTIVDIPAPADGQTVTLDCNPGIRILRASYGKSCQDFHPKPPAVNSFYEGNASNAVRQACNGKAHCDFAADVATLGDPAPGCAKDFSVEYRCQAGGRPLVRQIGASADSETMAIDCSDAEESNTNRR